MAVSYECFSRVNLKNGNDIARIAVRPVTFTILGNVMNLILNKLIVKFHDHSSTELIPTLELDVCPMSKWSLCWHARYSEKQNRESRNSFQKDFFDYHDVARCQANNSEIHFL